MSDWVRTTVTYKGYLFHVEGRWQGYLSDWRIVICDSAYKDMSQLLKPEAETEIIRLAETDLRKDGMR